MKKIIAIFALFMILLVAAVSAQEVPGTRGNDICIFLQREFSLQGDVPSYIPYKNEVIAGYTNSGELIGTLKTVDGKLNAIECTQAEEPTFIVRVKDLQTIKDIMGSVNPVDTLDEKLSSGDLSIEGTSFGRNIATFFTRIAVTVGSWFS